MTEKPHSLLKASDINLIDEIEFHHPLNPNSEIYLRSLGTTVGLKRIAVSLARVPAGKESFILKLTKLLLDSSLKLLISKTLHSLTLLFQYIKLL